MKILVNDFAGHPFQVQLSTALARRGHDVVHSYFADIPGPKGKLDCHIPNLRIAPIHVSRQFDAYSYVQRMRVHYEYAGLVANLISEFRPDVVLSGNTPTDAQYLLSRRCCALNIRFVHWIQDFYALALQALLTRKFGAAAGKLFAHPFHTLERSIFRKSEAVVYVSDDFSSYAASENYRPNSSVVIENWASLDDLPVRPKNNVWAAAHGLQDKFVFLYSGTMGLKHRPDTLLELALRFKDREDVRVVLVSQGIGRDILERAKQDHSLNNLLLLDFQPFSDLPDVLGAADVLLASCEPDAGLFCVPSKILSYLCAGRPVLLSVPGQNLASRIVTNADAGYDVEPDDVKGLLDKAALLYENPARCAQIGANARRYAEKTFDIDHICSIFEAVLRGASVEAARTEAHTVLT